MKLKYLFFFNSFSFKLENELNKNKYLSVFMLVQKPENYVNVDARFEISDNSTAHKSRSLQISERFCLTSSLIPDCDCNSTSSVDIYFSSIIACSLNSICLFYCKNARRLKA